jgi:cytochrome c553
MFVRAARYIPVLMPVAVIVAGMYGAASATGDRALGEYLSSECVTCHQLSGRGSGIPPIIGLPDDSFIAIMSQYRDKKRDNPIMQTIASHLSDEEIAALAAYFGSVKPQRR